MRARLGVMADAAIFDFDGVLVDSEPTHMRAIRETIQERGWDADEHELFHEFVGTSDRYCFVTIAARHGVELDNDGVMELVGRKLVHFLDAVDDGDVRAFDGAAELVRAAAKRVPVAVCSGSRRSTVLPVLERIGVLGVIKGLVGADDVEKTKPDPTPYLKAADMVGVDASACVAVEDSNPGITAAKSAGLRVFGVRHSCGDDQLVDADVVYDKIRDITIDRLLAD